MNAVLKNQGGASRVNVPSPSVAPPVSVDSKSTEQAGQPPQRQNDMNFNQIEQAVKTGIVTKTMFIEHLAKYGTPADKAEKLYEFVKKKL